MSEPRVSDYFALNVFLTTPKAVKMGAEGAQGGETFYRRSFLSTQSKFWQWGTFSNQEKNTKIVNNENYKLLFYL